MTVGVKTTTAHTVTFNETEFKELCRIVKEGNEVQALSLVRDIVGMFNILDMFNFKHKKNETDKG